MSENAVFLLSSKEYAIHATALIGALRSVGAWRGDIVIMSVGFTDDDIQLFERTGVIVHSLEDDSEMNFVQFKLFRAFTKKWKRTLYLNLDFLIFKDINPMFEQTGDILCEEQPFDFSNQFSKTADPACFELLRKEVDIAAFTFCIGGVLLDTGIIADDTYEELQALRDKYKTINRINGIPNGADQPILNVYFYKKWGKLIGSHFLGVESLRDDVIISHTTHWYAPWLKESPHHAKYLEGRAYFTKELLKT